MTREIGSTASTMPPISAERSRYPGERLLSVLGQAQGAIATARRAAELTERRSDSTHRVSVPVDLLPGPSFLAQMRREKLRGGRSKSPLCICL
jgi:hypothetical protein